MVLIDFADFKIEKMNFNDQHYLIAGLSAYIDVLKTERIRYRSLLEQNKGVSPMWNKSKIKECDEKIRRSKQLIHIISTSH